MFLTRRATPSLTRVAKPLSTTGASKPFPSLTIGPGGRLSANGTFAESQLAFLSPDASDVTELDDALRRANMGVVSHYYMDPELQGVLAACPSWPHLVTSDSLVMGDMAVKMVKEGNVDAIACLGVDFMAESVRAMLDTNGYESVPVYRLAETAIGCSLAEAAEGAEYRAWLEKAKNTPNSLHVVYINTSIVSKAEAHSLVPTITCTSSNVVKTVLSAFADVPDVTVWYGPDTYMGENLRTLFKTLTTMPDEKIKELHPAHSQESVKALLERFEVFPMGNCVVHHMFGAQVADQVRSDYPHALKTAHLEVPGDMFEVANEAALEGKGVVGSTSNILNFIVAETRKAVEECNARPVGNENEMPSKTLSVVLGTEAGMVTPIVRQVQRELEALPPTTSDGTEPQVQVEIVFPVAAEAVHATGESDGLALVPGVAGGEGCSAAGGCATCPFMKMNTLDALVDLAHRVEAENNATGDQKAKSAQSASSLDGFLPMRRGATIAGKPAAELGTLPIVHMRDLAHTGGLSESLRADIRAR